MTHPESSHHLYDSVPTHKAEPLLSTIEHTMLRKRRIGDLPPEHPPFVIPKGRAPSKVTNSSDLFADMSTPYDISHRMQPPQKAKKAKEADVEDGSDPNFIAMHQPKGKFWVADQRLQAQKLLAELEAMKKAASDEAKKEQTEFDASTVELQKNLEAHQKTLDEFTKFADEDNPERGAILHRIANFYRKLSGEIPQIKESFAERYQKATDELDQAQKERLKLEGKKDVTVQEIERQNKTIENLKQQIKEYAARCANAENQLREAMNDKTALTRSSQTNQSKLEEITRQIEEKKAQQNKLTELVDTLSKDIANRTDELKMATSELQEIERELERVRKEIASYRQIADDRAKLLEQLKNTPLRTAYNAARSQMSIQCNRVPKKPAKKPLVLGSNDSSINNRSQFEQIKSDMNEIQQKMTPQEGGKIEIKSFEDLQKVRETILKNNGIFDYSVESITKAQGGNFTLERVNEDESRIFAKWLMRRVMANSLKSRSVTDCSVQTDDFDALADEKIEVVKPQEENEIKFQITEKTPKSLLAFIKNSRFVRLLSQDESTRNPKPLEWMIKTIRSIYDEKTVDDRTAIREGQPVMRLPEYLMVWAFRQFGKPDLIQKGCWDIFITAHFYMQRFLEVTIFVRFLDEQLTIDQLSFFLNCRAWILQRCVSIPIQNDDLNLYYTETYLTSLQVSEFFHTTFSTTDVELIDDLTIRGCQCVDRYRAKDKDAANIPIMRILELAVGEQQDERVRKLRRMLAFFRPVPRMSLKRFSAFIKSMITNIDPNLIDSLYRSSLVQNSIRVDMDQEAFVKLFNDQYAKIVPQDFDGDEITCDEFAEYSPIYAMVLNRWKQFSPFLNRMLQSLSPNTYESAKSVASEIRHQIFQLLESKVSFDGVLFYQNYHRVLQAVMGTCLKLNLPDPTSFSKQVSDFQDILLKKFQAVLTANENKDEEQ